MTLLHTGLRPPFRFCVWVTSGFKASISPSGVETEEQTETSRMGSGLVTESMAEESLL